MANSTRRYVKPAIEALDGSRLGGVNSAIGSVGVPIPPNNYPVAAPVSRELEPHSQSLLYLALRKWQPM